MALGARSTIVGMVVRYGLTVALIRLVTGLTGALTLAGFTYGVSSSDPLTYISIAALASTVVVIASVVPGSSHTRKSQSRHFENR